jgi:hypothetical protein
MTRSFDDHVDLYAAFAQRVSALSPAAWERLAARCADLEGSSFDAVIGRARVFARPFTAPLEGNSQNSVGKAISAVAGVGITGLGIAFELARELGDVFATTPDEPLVRTRTTGTARNDRYVDANFLLENALREHDRAHPGLATAVRAASQAVLRHDWMPPEDFRSAYAVMEPEIPFADLTPKRELPRST